MYCMQVMRGEKVDGNIDSLKIDFTVRNILGASSLLP